MPFKSMKQERWMFANKSKMAKEFASKTPNIRQLPESAGIAKSPNMGVPGGSTYQKMMKRGVE